MVSYLTTLFLDKPPGGSLPVLRALPILSGNDNLLYTNTLKSELSTAKTYKMISTDKKSVANKHCNDIVTKCAVSITESQERLPAFYWLPKLHKRPYKARFIANSTTSLSKVLTSCLTAIKSHWIKYCEKRNKLFLVY